MLYTHNVSVTGILHAVLSCTYAAHPMFANGASEIIHAGCTRCGINSLKKTFSCSCSLIASTDHV